MHEARELPGSFHKMPEKSYARGCNWPAGYRWQIPSDLASGFYRVVSSCADDGRSFVQHHFFVVTPSIEKPEGRFR